MPIERICMPFYVKQFKLISVSYKTRLINSHCIDPCYSIDKSQLCESLSTESRLNKQILFNLANLLCIRSNRLASINNCVFKQITKYKVEKKNVEILTENYP